MRVPALPRAVRRAVRATVVASAAALLLGTTLVACSSEDDVPPPGSRTDATPSPSVAPSATTQAPTGRWATYVALGDSYTSGPFIPRVRLDPVGCARSSSNYPAFVASLLSVRTYTDVSCAGAETADLTRRQPVALGSNVPQLDAVDADTDLVTLGIGGNDFDVFSRLTGTCPELAADDRGGAPCREAFASSGEGTVDALTARIGERVERVLREIDERAPDATVVVVGYPRIVPASGTCDELPLAAGDYPWADEVERSLNDAVAAAADRGGARFADTYAATRGHDVCAGGDAWVGGRTTDPERGLAYHPREAGMRATAEAVARVLTGDDVRAGEPFDSGAPTMSRAEQRALAQRFAAAAGA